MRLALECLALRRKNNTFRRDLPAEPAPRARARADPAAVQQSRDGAIESRSASDFRQNGCGHSHQMHVEFLDVECAAFFKVSSTARYESGFRCLPSLGGVVTNHDATVVPRTELDVSRESARGGSAADLRGVRWMRTPRNVRTGATRRASGAERRKTRPGATAARMQTARSSTTDCAASESTPTPFARSSSGCSGSAPCD